MTSRPSSVMMRIYFVWKREHTRRTLIYNRLNNREADLMLIEHFR
jgi:hypothetical protein